MKTLLNIFVISLLALSLNGCLLATAVVGVAGGYAYNKGGEKDGDE